MTFRDPRADIVGEAYRRTQGHVAYLDESYQAPDGVNAHRRTFYVFTAVIVATEARDELRAGLVEIAGTDRWHTTEALLESSGVKITREMLEFLAEGDEVCVIAHQAPVANDDHDAVHDPARHIADVLAPYGQHTPQQRRFWRGHVDRPNHRLDTSDPVHERFDRRLIVGNPPRPQHRSRLVDRGGVVRIPTDIDSYPDGFVHTAPSV